jgi:glutathione synthase
VNRNVIVEAITDMGNRTIMAQRFVPEIARGDKRVLVIDGKPFSHCLARIPKAGETRGNLAAGGTGVAQPLSSRDREIGEALAGPLWDAGLLVVGIDVIGAFLTEVNVTSPTCFVEIGEQSGFDVGGLFADALVAACR